MENKLKASVRIVFALAALLAILAGGLGAGRAAGLVGGQTLTGRLEITYGDGQSGQTQELYSLVMADGSRTPLFFGETLPVSSEELTALRGELVTVSGGGQDGGMAVTRIGTLNGEAATPDAVTGSKPWVSLLCKFSDYAAEPKTPAYFQDMYRSSYPGMDHHWREQSFDLMNVVGSAATTQWYVLPQPRSYYVYNNAFDFTRATNDCTAVANAEIYFPNFVGINMMFNADLDGFAWGGSRYLTLDGVSKTFYTTWEPPWGYTDITVIAHEMGHGFGLPHSSGMYGQTYDNQWDVMSDTWSNCNRLRDATYGCLGQHTNLLSQGPRRLDRQQGDDGEPLRAADGDPGAASPAADYRPADGQDSDQRLEHLLYGGSTPKCRHRLRCQAAWLGGDHPSSRPLPQPTG